ncbi:hypothetical protein ANN_08072 [Periplaneta americana]|uniref:PIN domain-containing protein n=1 Tax=Periplaneta americana TaxID=6978 RepID=A0ABQ8T1M0_PERAM|nr:hypothetical protein ANN_08072 [Periplaneta americana]
MIMSRDKNILRNGNIKIGDLSFEEVEKFKYLGARVTNLNDTLEEFKLRELAQVVLRIRKIIFFGTVFLCGVDPPVLKLQKFDSGFSEYVSVVQSSSQGSPSSLPEEDQSDSELVVESFSEDEDEDKRTDKDGSVDAVSLVPTKDAESLTGATPAEIQTLLHRKEELERRHRRQEKHRQRVQAILRDSVVSVEIEVKPHNLVPDTNCFIDYLNELQILAQAGPVTEHYYTLMVPLVVCSQKAERIYKTVILPVVLYGCETWTFTLREEQRLRVFENKVLRKIFGTKRDGPQLWSNG